MFARKKIAKDQRALAVLGRQNRSERSILDIKERRARRRKRVLIFLGLGLSLAILFGGGWLIYRLAIFTLKDIRVEGNAQVATDDILQVLQNRIISRSIFTQFLGFHNILAWPAELATADLAALPTIENITIAKNYAARTVTLAVTERKEYGIWCFEKQDPRTCFWFDKAGVIFKPAPAAEGNLLAIVNDTARDALPLGQKIMPADFVPNLFSIFEVLRASDLPVTAIRLENLELQEVKVSLAGGPELYFSLRFSASGALNVIQTLEQQPNNLTSTPWSRLTSVDFRVENRAYFK